MLIRQMTRQASIDLLVHARLGRLACAHEGQPYITPISCVYEDGYLYAFSMLGQKITWMRQNPAVCLEVEEIISPQDWSAVIVFGRYEELPDTAQHKVYRKHAFDLLQTRPLWWEPGYVKTILHERVRPMQAIYFRICIDQISGRRGIPTTVLNGKASGGEVSPVR